MRGHEPSWGDRCWFAENATIIGDVQMGDACTIWYQAVLRGDVNSIRLGDRVNVQDGSVIHCTFKQTEVSIGNDVTIGHKAIIHGCSIRDQVLVGMGAIIMDHAVVNKNCLIAAGAVVLERSICESGFIYAGVPAKKVKAVSAEKLEDTIKRIARAYPKYAEWYQDGSADLQS